MNLKPFFQNKNLVSCLAGILFVSVVGSLMHFVYDWSGQNFLISLFAPVNESTWEHMKLIFFPTLLFYIIETWLPYTDNHNLPNHTDSKLQRTIDGAALLTGTALIPILFYTYSGILGFHIPAVDILTFFISVIIAFVLRYHLNSQAMHPQNSQFTESIKKSTTLVTIAVAVLFLCFLIFTSYPPNLGIFSDPTRTSKFICKVKRTPL